MNKNVKITDCKGNVDTGQVKASKNAKDHIIWYAHDDKGAIVVFASPDGSPFLETTFHVPAGGSVSSGPPSKGQVGKQYKYIVVGDCGSTDPVVIIDY
jgi:hypothetical protein